MNVKNMNFKDLTEEWIGKETKTNMYKNKELTQNGKGIDYTQFIQLRFHSINEKHIADIYGIEGWYLLWNLMCQAKSNQTMFLETTINTIYLKINKKITTDNIKKYLIKFNQEGILKLNKVKGININTPIQIFIAYNNNEYYPFKNDKWTGYRALPIGFIEIVLNNASAEEWAVFTALCVRYRYWQTKPSQDSMGTIYYKLFLEHYSFPTMEQVGEIIGRKKSQVGKYIDKLAKNNLGVIRVYTSDKTEMTSLYNKDGKFIGNKRKNYIYYIPLFERVEYIYQHIIKIDKRDRKQKINNSAHFDDIAASHNYSTLTDADYFNHYFKNYLKDYKKALDKKDFDIYKQVEKKCEHENGITNIPLTVKETIEDENIVKVNFG
ncbi:hypothetical protein [Clostridium botulinum]|uniref:hypothetical protein n=1 Tax=Clostridium botulinum TaxID=1491 RepID=UPI000773AE5D|nr:hypothetical protein [Clostridium botulinum]MBN3411213.1 butanol dehydrogenase [Clostridium botulinum]